MRIHLTEEQCVLLAERGPVATHGGGSVRWTHHECSVHPHLLIGANGVRIVIRATTTRDESVGALTARQHDRRPIDGWAETRNLESMAHARGVAIVDKSQLDLVPLVGRDRWAGYPCGARRVVGEAIHVEARVVGHLLRALTDIQGHLS